MNKTIIVITIVFVICLLIIYNLIHQNKYDNNSSNSSQGNDDIKNKESKTDEINHFEPRLLTILEHGFHDNFANNNKSSGWRHWYLRNKSDYQVNPTGNFDGIVTRNYLDTMCSLDNWFNGMYFDGVESKIIE